MDVQLLHPNLLAAALRFYFGLAKWLAELCGLPLEADGPHVSALDRDLYDGTRQVTGKAPMAFACLPEYLIDDIAEFLLFLSRFSETTLLSAAAFEIYPMLRLMVLLASSPGHCRNPYLRAKLLEIMGALLPCFNQLLGESFTGELMCVQQLLPACLRLYVDIEAAARGSEFYDKYRVRQQVSGLLLKLTELEPHRKRLTSLVQTDPEVVKRVLNVVINDAIYLLDESLRHAAKLTELKTTRTFSAQQAAAQANVHLRTAAVLASRAVQVLRMLVEHPDTRRLMMGRDMSMRLADTIDQYVVRLGGKDRSKAYLKRHPVWNSDRLLGWFLEMYEELMAEAAFIEAVAKEQHWLHQEQIPTILKNIPPDLSHGTAAKRKVALEGFFRRVLDQRAQLEQEALGLGDIPDEFLDPLLQTLMEEPVLLPTSRVTVDRAVIARHLLNDPTDPFNRQPLSAKDLIPDAKLKARIEAWKAERKKLAPKGNAGGAATTTKTLAELLAAASASSSSSSSSSSATSPASNSSASSSSSSVSSPFAAPSIPLNLPAFLSAAHEGEIAIGPNIDLPGGMEGLAGLEDALSMFEQSGAAGASQIQNFAELMRQMQAAAGQAGAGGAGGPMVDEEMEEEEEDDEHADANAPHGSEDERGCGTQ